MGVPFSCIVKALIVSPSPIKETVKACQCILNSPEERGERTAPVDGYFPDGEFIHPRVLSHHDAADLATSGG